MNSKPKTSASQISYPIDISTRGRALASIKRVFDNWNRLTNGSERYHEDIWRFYRLINGLNSLDPPSDSLTIIKLLNQEGISYFPYHVRLSYHAIKMEKNYCYLPVEDHGLRTYMKEAAFNEDYETVSFRLHITTDAIHTFFDVPMQNDDISGRLLRQEHPPMMTTVYEYGPFKRFFNADQRIYGYDSSYTPKLKTITYRSRLLPFIDLLQEASITLIDDDKVIITYQKFSLNHFWFFWISHAMTTISAYLTRQQHYDRNIYQPSFPETLTEAKKLYPTLRKKFGKYFHQLGSYDGDHSNESNVKYEMPAAGYTKDRWPLSTIEVIYDSSGILVRNPLVMGTFNFLDDNLDGHHMYDVYPYLLWGNSPEDSSKLKERFIWDYGSSIGQHENWRSMRGPTLYEQLKFSANTELSDREYDILASRLD